ncbi:hypothetical protein [Staphylococcus canis]|uniref:Uncharacterized protein n=1 Tax=Staphylococcus canis TaxID=2724942 RepID=A0ABS0T8G2_9STAP|nr:hypothetical protein [Staphylococcus canis]MBI5975030.1 hypothetical protein [Staphylococcus canis]
MQFIKVFCVTFLLSLIGFFVGGLVAHDVAWLHILSLSFLLSLLVTWSVNPITPFTLRGHTNEEHHTF